MTDEVIARVESELEVKTYIQDLKFALNNGAKINFQAKRCVDDNSIPFCREAIYARYVPI